MEGLDLIYFDPEAEDYHPGHARLFCERARRDSRIRTAHFLLPKSFERVASDVLRMIAETPKFSLEFATPEFAALAMPSSGLSSRASGRLRWDEIRRLLEKRPGATVFTTPLDDVLSAAALDRRPLKGFLTGVVLFCAPAVFSPSVLTRAKISAKYLFSRRSDIPVVFTYDEVFMARGPKIITSAWRHIYDPLPLSAAQMERLFSVAPPQGGDKVEFFVFGSIAGHKGIYEILGAAALLAPEIAARVRLRFLGAPPPDEREQLVAAFAEAQRNGKVEIVFEDMFATEDQLIDALTQCDVMMATRRHHQGVSHNLIWAAAAGRPVISQNSAWMGHVTQERRLGSVCDPLDPHAIAQAMTEAVAPGWREKVFDAAGARAFAADFTADNFYEAIVGEVWARRSLDASATPQAPKQAVLQG